MEEQNSDPDPHPCEKSDPVFFFNEKMLLFLLSAVSCAQATEESLKELQRCVSPAIFNDAYLGR